MVVLPPSPPVVSAAVENVARVAPLAPASGARSTGAALPVSPESTSVFLSGIAQRLLSELQRDPSLDIDAAFTRSLSDPVLTEADDGGLFSPAGLLQPFVPSPLLPQPADASASIVDPQAPLDTLIEPPQPDRAGVLNLVDLTGNETDDGLTVTNDNEAPLRGTTAVPFNSTGTLAQPVAANVASTLTVTPPEPVSVAPVALPETPAVTPVTNPIDVADNPALLNASAVAAQPLATARVLDPYQQAALIAGLTSFGKDQAVFRAGAPDDGGSIPGVATVAPVRGRSDESTEAWLDARR
ncbi:hypothetical protein [Uliginosibacterium sp. H1]|uniref:hypothetical protein n=1 Tax=Uliginosibacterium sp. H1 TaxID=3114757 RepID=UPI002E197CDD|nr:hypothetical protein [Uliginosibacterium sp. H1]